MSLILQIVLEKVHFGSRPAVANVDVAGSADVSYLHSLKPNSIRRRPHGCAIERGAFGEMNADCLEQLGPCSGTPLPRLVAPVALDSHLMTSYVSQLSNPRRRQ